MTNTFETRPFDLAQAKAGAPVVTDNGYPARIICFDKKTDSSTCYIIALTLHNDWETIRQYSANTGMYLDGNPGFNLKMAPIGYVEGKAAFIGDELEFKYKTGVKWSKLTIITHNLFKQEHLEFRWPKKPVMFKGREITMESRLWFCNELPSKSNAIWRNVRVGDIATDEGLFNIHFVNHANSFEKHWEWEKPFIDFKGRQLTKYSELWHNPSGAPNVDGEWAFVTASAIYGFQGRSHFDFIKDRNTDYTIHYSWEKPSRKVQKEVWQAVYKSKNGRGKEYGSIHYPSEKDCTESCRDDDRFIKAERTDTYFE